MVSTFVAQNRITISRLFWASELITPLLMEKMFADRLIGQLQTRAGHALIGIVMVGRLWCSLYIRGRKINELVAEGPYSMAREPRPFFLPLGFVGIAVCTQRLSFCSALSHSSCSCTPA